MGFTDDAGNQETLTSSATAEVTAAAMEPGPLTRFTVVDASDQTVVGALTAGATLTLEDPASGSYGIRVDTDPDVEIGSVRLELMGPKTVSQTENYAPYSLYGDDADGLHGEGMPAGAYTLRATAYSEKSLSGDDLGALEVSFTVADSSSDPQDTPENTPATGAPTISGTVQVGETLTADTSGIADADGLGNAVFEYQWIADDTEVAGATSSTYTPVDADKDKTIKVRVGFTDGGGNPESLTSPATAPVAPAADDTEYSCPIVSATLTVGRVGDNYGYQSFLNPQAGSLIPNSFVLDDVTYTVGSIQTEADYFTVFGVDRELPVGFTLELDGEQFESSDASLGSYTYGHVYTWLGRGMDWDVGEEVAVSLILRERVENTPQMGGPAICGTAQVGQTLTADTAGVSDDDGLGSGVFEYQWVRSDGTTDTDIAGATGATYTLVAADEDKTVKVRVSFTDGGGNPESQTSAATPPVTARPNSPAKGAPTISGTAQALRTLTAHTSGISDADGLAGATFTYQWVANHGATDTDIAGATNSTYTLVDADEGKIIRLRVSFTDDGGNSESLTSAATATVIDALAPANLSAEQQDDGVSLSWSGPVDGTEPVTGYEIRRTLEHTSDGIMRAVLTFVDGTETQWLDTLAGESGIYTYRVTARRGDGPSAESRVQIVIGSISSADPVTGAQKAEVSVCTRTPQVRDAILAAVSGVSDCEDVTDEHLDGIRTLDLSGQGITALQAKDFDGLIWVRSVDLSDNLLTDLPNDGGLGGLSTFRFKICGVDYELRGYSCNADGTYNGNNVRAFVYGGHSWLTKLDLSNNQLSSLPTGVFAGFYQLGRLDLSGNLLTSLDEEFFRSPSATLPLGSLDLSDNSLTSLPKEFWFETRNLVSLDLSGNDLLNLRDDTFREMMVYRKGSLKTLDLSDNGLLHAPRELWDEICYPRVANLTLAPGNPDLPACELAAHVAVPWSATMTVGRSASTIPLLVLGWDGGDATIGGDALTDADFVYDHETYEISNIYIVSRTGQLTITFGATNNGSISNEGVRHSMALHVDGTAFFLGHASYARGSDGRHSLTWRNSGLTWAAGDNVELAMRVPSGRRTVELETTPLVYSATMTAGSSTSASTLFGWDGDGIFLGNDDLTDADFVYENETYEFTDFFFDIDTGRLSINFDATNNGSISDAAVRRLMTLYVDGKAFSLGDATYSLEGSGAHALTWQNAGLTWVAGDNVQLDLTVTPPVWSATMTVGSGFISGLVGWDVGALFGSDALSDADFVYDHETYELKTISYNTGTGDLSIAFDATNSGSIADAAVRGVMTLYADGAVLALGDANYNVQVSFLTWSNPGLTWATGDTVELEIRVTR